MQKAGMNANKVQGYDRIAYGHLAAAYYVRTFPRKPTRVWATRSAAQYPLGWILFPLIASATILSCAGGLWNLPAVKAFLDVFANEPRCAASWRYWQDMTPQKPGTLVA